MIYFSQSQLMFSKTNEHQTTSQKGSIVVSFFMVDLEHVRLGRVRFSAADSALDISATELFFLDQFFLQLRCFGLQLASLALGLRTLVGTGSRSTAFKELPASLFFLHCTGNVLYRNVVHPFQGNENTSYENIYISL